MKRTRRKKTGKAAARPSVREKEYYYLRIGDIRYGVPRRRK